jgi:hypothetical protein
MRVSLLCCIAILAMSTVVNADTSHWTATSTASIAITGNISVQTGRIVFGNGAEIRMIPAAADRPDVYRVDPPANPVLASGNRLCGENPPTFIVLGRSDGAKSLAQSFSLFLKVFHGPDMPAASTAEGMVGGGPGLCAILNFERAARSSSGTESLGRDALRRVQESLNALGYDAGPADGATGTRTQSALTAFQRKAGLRITGAPDVQSLEALTRTRESRSLVVPSRPGGFALDAERPSSRISREWQMHCMSRAGLFFDSPDLALRSARRCAGINSWNEPANGIGMRVAVSLSSKAWDLN